MRDGNDNSSALLVPKEKKMKNFAWSSLFLRPQNSGKRREGAGGRQL
jgi:hypothetical protein